MRSKKNLLIIATIVIMVLILMQLLISSKVNNVNELNSIGEGTLILREPVGKVISNGVTIKILSAKLNKDGFNVVITGSGRMLKKEDFRIYDYTGKEYKFDTQWVGTSGELGWEGTFVSWKEPFPNSLKIEIEIDGTNIPIDLVK